MRLCQAIADFLARLELEKKAAQHTMKSYRCDLHQFHSFAVQATGSAQPLIEALSVQLLRRFISWLSARRYAPATINRRIAALGVLLARLADGGCVPVSLRKALHYVPQRKALPHYLNVRDTLKLLYTPSDSTLSGLRARAILSVLYSTACRVSELEQINREDLNFNQGTVKLFGKGSRERLGILAPVTIAALNAWLPHRGLLMARQGDGRAVLDLPGPLFVNLRGSRLGVRNISRIIKHAAIEARIDPRTSPHSLRHSAASHLLQNGVDLSSIQTLLGHRCLSTTTIYLHLNPIQLRGIFDKTHPHA